MLTKTISYTQARARFASILDEASSTHEPIIVERKGKAPVALIDAAELSSLLELVHLLRSPANAHRLFESMNQMDAGQGMALEEFRSKRKKLSACP